MKSFCSDDGQWFLNLFAVTRTRLHGFYEWHEERVWPLSPKMSLYAGEGRVTNPCRS